ncbi:hypothetical protein H0H93_001278 [Arthromyces matolae]|nr:hypothetical protein H0H93_001278 [Arthromyces matolae]
MEVSPLDVATLSGPGGANFRLFDAITGTLQLERRLHAQEYGRNANPLHLGSHVTFGTDGEVYLLSNGLVAQRLDTATGIAQWTWTSQDHLSIATDLVTTSTALFVVAFTRSTTALSLHVTALDPQTGSVISTRKVPSDVKEHRNYVVLRSFPENLAPHVVWIENGNLRYFKLTTELDTEVHTLFSKDSAGYARIVDVGLSPSGSAVAVAIDGSAVVLRLFEGTVMETSVFEPLIDEEDELTEMESTFVGSPGETAGEVIMGRVYWSHKINKIMVDTLSSMHDTGTPSKLSRNVVRIPFDTSSYGIIVHATLSRSTSRSPPSLLLTTTSGTVQLWDLGSNPTEAWTREESLAAAVLSEFVQLPESQTDGIADSDKAREGLLGRILRHANDSQNLPRYLTAFVRRFLTGSYASSASDFSSSKDLVRDTFGFRQVIVVATVQGKIFGLDSSTGSIIWSRILGLGWAAEVGASVVPVKMFVFSEGATGGQVVKTPEVIIVAQRRADNTLVDTVIFHIDALTGASATVENSVTPQEDSNGLLQGYDIVPGPVVEAYLLSPTVGSSTSLGSSASATAVLLFDEFLQAYLYPSTPDTRATLRELRPTLNFPLRSNSEGVTRVIGHSIAPHYAGEQAADDHDGERGYVAYATWTLGLPPDEVVKTMIPQIRGPVASVGKVLGNRTTLYKYLNPSLFLLLTAPASGTTTTKSCGLYVVDGVKGSVVYKVSLPTFLSKDGRLGKDACDIKASLAENWLVYQYYDPDWAGAGLSKGWKLVSVELYEGAGIDDKTKSSDMSAFANDSVNVHAYEQAFILPHAITALSPTSTKFGMSVKDLIVASRTHQVVSIQRNLLNPRRPHRKVTNEEQEEFLVTYEPLVGVDPRRVLSHNYEVANVQRIVTSPTLLESTSLVFAYGLDMFLTRVAPSNTFDVLNENFNKVQLVLTVSGLALAIIFSKPMVQRKRLKEKWY